jgi:hypothetical protein
MSHFIILYTTPKKKKKKKKRIFSCFKKKGSKLSRLKLLKIEPF